jgi:hypothetical protein
LMLMSLVLTFGALMWLKIDPTHELVPDQALVQGLVELPQAEPRSR